MLPELAVVMITKDQAWNVARLIESVLEGTAHVSAKQIVLVDSASRDETIELACRYQIGVVRLRPDQRLTAAAGRYIGYQHTTARLVLFLDGDMELCPGWLEKALDFVQCRPDVAVITGQIIDQLRTAKSPDRPPLIPTGTVAATEVLHGGGAALYKRSVLEQVGTFNPYLYSDEEPELCLRIRHAGYRVVQLAQPLAYHYSNPSEALSTLAGRWQRNLYLGQGQCMRYYLGDDLLWRYVKERGYGCIPALGLVSGLIALVWTAVTRRWRWFSLWILLAGGLLVGDAVRKRSVYRVVYSLCLRLLFVGGTAKGFLLKPLDPESYRGLMDIIKPVSQVE